MIENGWLREKSYFKSFSMGWKLKKILHSEQSKFQKIDVVETRAQEPPRKLTEKFFCYMNSAVFPWEITALSTLQSVRQDFEKN